MLSGKLRLIVVLGGRVLVRPTPDVRLSVVHGRRRVTSAMLLWTLAAASRVTRVVAAQCGSISSSGLRERVELRLPPEGATGAFSFRRQVLVSHRRGSPMVGNEPTAATPVLPGRSATGNVGDLTTTAARNSRPPPMTPTT